MKAKVSPISTSVTTDSGEEIKNITCLSVDCSVNSQQISLTVNSMSDQEFEILDKNCEIEIRSNSLYEYPIKMIIHHLEGMGYKVSDELYE